MSITSLIFVSCFFAGLALCIFRHPMYGLYTYVAVFYLDAPSRWWEQDLPNIRWSFIAALITLTVTLIQQDNRMDWRRHTAVLLFISYTLWMWIQSIWALSPADHSNGVTLFTKFCIVLVMVITLLDNREKLQGFLFANAIGCMYIGYLAYTSYSGGRLDGVGGSGIDDSNTLGMHMSAVVFFAAAIFMTRSKQVWLIAAATVPLILNTIAMAGSRGALLAMVCGGLAFAFLRPQDQKKQILFYGAIGLLAFAFLAGGDYWNRMRSISDAATRSENMDRSAESRFVVIEAQLEMAKKYPLGGGHRTTAFLSYIYIPEEYQSSEGGRSSHNTFLSTLVDQGIPGLILWLMIVTRLSKYSRDVRKFSANSDSNNLCWLNAGIGAAIIVILAGGMFAPFLRAEIYVWLIACQCSIYTIAKSNTATGVEGSSK